jgi:predicted aldo/keto reductase-like oxidoreductase
MVVLQYRVLGKTDLTVSEVGFGGIPILRLPASEAVKILQYSLERGITFYDTANAYKDSEDKIGQAFGHCRTKVVIATKTGRRDAAGATTHLENSLRMLRSDYIDLYQLHQVSQEKDWQAITAPGGALEAVVKAREQGKIRHLGITSHNLAMAIKLVKTGLFETIQFPFNFIEQEPKEELHKIAKEMNLGNIVMKPFAGGALDNAALAFKFLRQYPEAIPIPGFDSVASIDEILTIYEKPNQVKPEDLAAMEEYRRELGQRFCRRCEYCQPCPHGVMITPAMGYPIVAKRMSPQVSIEFSKAAMESVTNCVECGACLPRCPYELAIPQIIRKNYEMFTEHRRLAGRN